jgi:2-polyprenyl-3-methyl-5-hydroxy-6-metoxy-1,4-benzoquinol methylase
MSNAHLKANVNKFSEDAASSGSYAYTTERLSAKLANLRMSRAFNELYPCRGKRILDMGCGDGTYTLELARAGAVDVLGVDPAEAAVENARRKAEEAGVGNVRFMSGNIYDLDIGERFDCTVLRGVLHHLPDAGLAIRKLASLSDHMFIVEPNGTNPVLKLIEKTSRYHIEHEEQSFTLNRIRSWLDKAEMRIVARQCVNLVPMFCPDWFAHLCKFFEPAIERIPLVRNVCCGQYIILAERR